MKKTTKSILQELSNLSINKDKNYVIESRGNHIIESAINLLSLIREQYDEETSNDLEKRFINSIRASDPAKFKRGLFKMNKKSS